MNQALGSTLSETGLFATEIWKIQPETKSCGRTDQKHRTRPMEWDASVTDEQLMLACQKGRVEALEEIYRRYYSQVLMFILRIMQNRDLAEDLAQETFLHVFNSRNSWQPRSKFTSWLYRIARNLCIDEKRRYWNRKVQMDSQFMDDSGDENSSILSRHEDHSGNARERYATKIDEQVIKQALNQLSEEQREVIVLNKYQGLSYIEIAEILGASPESIKQRAYRAHLKLRQILKPLLKEYS